MTIYTIRYNKCLMNLQANLHMMQQVICTLCSDLKPVVAELTHYTLGFVRPLSDSLQGKSCNLLKGHTEAQNIIEILQNIRNEDMFDKLYNRVLCRQSQEQLADRDTEQIHLRIKPVSKTIAH
ncbi:hypothetical protein MAR_015254 [Mya arenaria]|uniref:Uncharacterized protein n=1 Tax=Mya arenaria TaxID=6604 RepID=A0ABY7FGI7_MYAAR|nr:hypothetical protein MAR_015254 [Mya arenaria]